MENVVVTEQETPVEQPTTEQEEQKSVSVTNVEVTNENVALNVMVSFLNIAQKRGAFSLDESAKIWECVQKFIQRGKPV